MRIIRPSAKILLYSSGEDILQRIERFGRVCYKSETSITESSAKSFVQKIIHYGHESVIEHCSMSVKIICDRGVSHEIVRHRIASYSQESTRFCNYMNDRFGREITVIKPCFWEEDSNEYNIWKKSMEQAEMTYFELISKGATPQEARSVLPNSLKTEIIVTMNLREWRHFFRLRTSENAHPQMREITIPLLNEIKKMIPVIFDDINT